MTIDEAIQELEWELERDKMALSERTVSAIKLGIRSLKREKTWRENPRWGILPLLPGETKE